MVCLDSGAGSYDQLWLTTSLRGMVSGVLKVEILTEVFTPAMPRAWCRRVFASCARCWTGWRTPAPDGCCRELPLRDSRRSYRAGADRADPRRRGLEALPLGLRRRRAASLPTTTEPLEAPLNRTWRPTLWVTGAEGFPELGNAGGVLRPYTAFKLSLRLPPLVDGSRRRSALIACFRGQRAPTRKSPSSRTAAPVRSAPPAGTRRRSRPWLETALNRASQTHFGAPLGYIGQGGTIPLMNMLQQAQMMVCGVLNPKNNAHGAQRGSTTCRTAKLTAAVVAQVIAACPWTPPGAANVTEPRRMR